MSNQDTSKIREKILSILRMKGPTLPVYIAKETGISILFASAFLSELLSDRLIKMSKMRVGNSPVYFMQGQENQLEKFSVYLKSKEKEAFLLLQEKKFLKDSEQTPAIRVALREIKDFAFPFRRNGEIIWRYLTSKESEFKQDIKSIEEHEYVEAKPKAYNKEERELGEKLGKDINIDDIEKLRKEKEGLEKKKKIEKETKEEGEEEYTELPLPEKIEESKEEKKVEEKEKPYLEKKKTAKEKTEKPKPKERKKSQKTPKKKATPKKDEKFFEKIKEFLSKEAIEILSVESFNKNEILLRIKSKDSEKLLVAYNKKRILDTDIINANKKASQLNLKYMILGMGEPLKKLSNLIEAAQNLDKIEKIET